MGEPDELVNTVERDDETNARERKRLRRVSFADITSVHVFARDDDFETPPDQKPSSENAEPGNGSLGFVRDGGDSDDSKDTFRNDDDGENVEDGEDEDRELFVRNMDFSSPGSIAGSLTSNDDDNFFGPVSTSFINAGRLSSESAASFDHHDVTLDSATFSLHFRSLVPSEGRLSDSGGHLKTPTGVHLSLEENTPTIGSGSTTQGSSIALIVKKPILNCISDGESSDGGGTNDMSLINGMSKKYDYGRLSPALESLLAEGPVNLHPSASNQTGASTPSKSSSDKNKSLTFDQQISNQTGASTPSKSSRDKNKSLTFNQQISNQTGALESLLAEGPVSLQPSASNQSGASTPSKSSSDKNKLPTFDQQTSCRHSSPKEVRYIEADRMTAGAVFDANNMSDQISFDVHSPITEVSVPVDDIDGHQNQKENKLVQGIFFDTDKGSDKDAHEICRPHMEFSNRGTLLQKEQFKMDNGHVSHVEDGTGRDSPSSRSSLIPLANTPTLKIATNLQKSLSSKSGRFMSRFGINANQDHESPLSVSSLRVKRRRIFRDLDLISSPLVNEQLHSSLNKEKTPLSENMPSIKEFENFESHEAGVDSSETSFSGSGRKFCFLDALNKNEEEKRKSLGASITTAGVSSEISIAEQKRIWEVAADSMSSFPTPKKHVVLGYGGKSENILYGRESGERTPICVPSSTQSGKLTPTTTSSIQFYGLKNSSHRQPLTFPGAIGGPMLTPVTPSYMLRMPELNVKKQVTGTPKLISSSVIGLTPEKVEDSVSSYASEFRTVSINETGQITAETLAKHWENLCVHFSGVIPGPLPASIDTLGSGKLSKLEFMLAQLEKVKKYEKLRDEILSQKNHIHGDKIQLQRASEARWLLYRLTYEQAKLQLLNLKRERLLKKAQLLQSRMQEYHSLKDNFLRFHGSGMRDAEICSSPSAGSESRNQEEHRQVTGKRQDLALLDQRVKSLIGTFHAACNMKGDPDCAETILLVTDHVQKLRHHHDICQEFQLWELEGENRKDGNWTIVLNYGGLLSQRLTTNVDSVSSRFSSIELNEACIRKTFPNMNASTAFEYVFKRKGEYILGKSFKEEAQITKYRIGNLLDVLKEVQQARIELSNLINATFQPLYVGQLNMDLCFINFTTGRKVKLNLDMSDLHSAIYPSEIHLSQLQIQLPEPQTSLSYEITNAIENLEAGQSMIFRFCQRISQLVRASSI